MRAIRDLTNAARSEKSGEFEALYSHTSRSGIAPEKLLWGLLLRALYSVHSERQFMEQPEVNLLFRWFVGLVIEDRVWDATVFTENRERLLASNVAWRCLAHLVFLPALKRLVSQIFEVSTKETAPETAPLSVPNYLTSRRAAGFSVLAKDFLLHMAVCDYPNALGTMSNDAFTVEIGKETDASKLNPGVSDRHTALVNSYDHIPYTSTGCSTPNALSYSLLLKFIYFFNNRSREFDFPMCREC